MPSANMTGYLSRLSYLESNGSNAVRNPSSGAQGRFQFLPSTQRDAEQRLGINSAALIADDPSVQYPAVADYIRTINPSAYAEIEAGRFDSADRLLSGTWPSLPSGSQAQGTARQQQADTFLPGGSNAGTLPGGGTLASGAVPAGPPVPLAAQNGTPVWRLTVDGQDKTAVLGDRLLSINATDYAGQQTDTVEIRIDDRDARIEAPPTGGTLGVAIGYKGEELKSLGSFLVDEVGFEGPTRTMVIKALGMAAGGEGDGLGLPATATASVTEGTREYLKLRRTESWHDTTLQEIAQKVAKRNSLKVEIKATEEIKIRHEDQTNESDANFMTRLAGKHGLVIKPVDGRLAVTPRGAGLLGRNVGIDASQVTSWNARTKERARYRVVRAKWIDRKSRKEKVTTITSKDAQSGSTFELPELFRDEAEARSAAAAKLSGLTSGVVGLNLSLPGVPWLTAEGSVTLTGFRGEIDDQPWVIRTVSHTIGSGGFSTSIEAGTLGDEGDGGGAAPGAGGARAGSIASAAETSVGMSTTGAGLGSNACVWAVNRVLARAGVTPPWGDSNYVPDARAALANGGGVQLSGPEPGAIAIMKDSGNPPYPHIGIVQSDGQIVSNSSTRGSFSWVASPSSYDSYYGGKTEYWRLN